MDRIAPTTDEMVEEATSLLSYLEEAVDFDHGISPMTRVESVTAAKSAAACIRRLHDELQSLELERDHLLGRCEALPSPPKARELMGDTNE